MDLLVAHRLAGLLVAGEEQHREEVTAVGVLGTVVGDDLVDGVVQVS
jgi:hypothetical protein